jgi:hypothetical protein
MMRLGGAFRLAATIYRVSVAANSPRRFAARLAIAYGWLYLRGNTLGSWVEVLAMKPHHRRLGR